MGTFFHELVHGGLYKRSQGRITRQVTFASVAVVIALGLLRLSTELATSAVAANAAAWFSGHPLLVPFYWLAFGVCKGCRLAAVLLVVSFAAAGGHVVGCRTAW